MNDVVDFLHDYLETDAELAVAALGQPDDDAYLEIESRARQHYLLGESLGPAETRWARPGGHSPAATVDARDSIRPAVLYAVATAGPDSWLALVGDKRDLSGAALAAALLVRRTAEGLRIAGRASLDPFSPGITWEQSGGAQVDLDRAGEVQVLQLPTRPAHAELVQGWGQA